MEEERRERRRRRQLQRRRRSVALLLVLVAIVGAWFFLKAADGVSKERETVAEIQGIPVVTDYIAEETKARSGTERRIKYIVIHETGNAGRNANAASHNNFLHDNADLQTTSWHYTVDDHEIYHHIPDNEIAFHAGDKLREDGGNVNGIGIEMCVNPESDYETTLQNAAKLAAFLMDTYHLKDDALKKHQDFSGKNCPEILIETGRWNAFAELVQSYRK